MTLVRHAFLYRLAHALHPLLRLIARKNRNEYFDPVQFLLFCCVGVANTLLDFLVYLLSSGFLPLTVARMLSWIVACTFSYTVNKRWVFHHKAGGATPALRFGLVNLLSLLLGLIILNLLTHFGWGRFVAYAATLPVIALGNSFGYKLWSFKKKSALAE
jgi:putative flippase GtrA